MCDVCAAGTDELAGGWILRDRNRMETPREIPCSVLRMQSEVKYEAHMEGFRRVKFTQTLFTSLNVVCQEKTL